MAVRSGKFNPVWNPRLGRHGRRGGSSAPPVSPPTLLTAPTIILSGITATITLGTFSGATSQTDVLLVDGVSVGDAVAGDLDVSAYAGSALVVRSTGTNVGGSTVSDSDPVTVAADVAPTVTGNPETGQALAMSGGTATDYRYASLAIGGSPGSETAISGATSASYTIGGALFNKYILAQYKFAGDTDWRTAEQLGPVSLHLDFADYADDTALESVPPLAKITTPTVGSYTAKVLSGYAYGVGVTGNFSIWGADADDGTADKDHYFDVLFPVGGGVFYIHLNYVDNSNYVRLYVSSGGLLLTIRVANTAVVNLVSIGGSFSGKRVRGEVIGRVLKIYNAGVQVGSSYDLAALSLPAGAKFGLMPSASNQNMTADINAGNFLGGITLGAATFETMAYVPEDQRITMAYRSTEALSGVETRIVDASDTVIQDWTVDADATDSVVHTGVLSITAQGANVTVSVRDPDNTLLRASMTIAVPITAAQQPLAIGMNMVSAATVSVDKFKYQRMAVTASGYKNVVANFINNDDSGAGPYRSGVSIGLDDLNRPSHLPATGALQYTLDIFQTGLKTGDYHVYTTPGMTWDWRGYDGSTRTAYDSVAGTATITVTGDSANIPYLAITALGPDAPDDFFFRILHADDDDGASPLYLPSSPISAEAISDLSILNGALRWMGPDGTNINGQVMGTNGVSYWTDRDDPDYFEKRMAGSMLGTTEAATFPNVSIIGPSSMEMKVKLAEATTKKLWINTNILAGDDYITGMATWLANTANCPADIDLYLEHSNENWNNALAFRQTYITGQRAVANSLEGWQQAADDSMHMFGLFEAQFGADNPRIYPVLAWWMAQYSPTIIASLLDRSDAYLKVRGLAAAPYGPKVHAYESVSTGTAATAHWPTQAERDLIETDVDAYKTAMFASEMRAQDWTIANQWLPFVNELAQYCVGKGLARDAIVPTCYEMAPFEIYDGDISAHTPSGQLAAVRDAWQHMVRDSRMGDVWAYRLGLHKAQGGHIVLFNYDQPQLFDSAAKGSSSHYTFAVTDRPGSTTDAPYAQIATWAGDNL